jgi:hypothetical protein
VFSIECVLYSMCSTQRSKQGNTSVENVFSIECVLYSMCSTQRSKQGNTSVENVFSIECVLYSMCSTQRGKQGNTSVENVFSIECVLYSMYSKPRNSKPNPHSQRSLARFSSTRCRWSSTTATRCWPPSPQGACHLSLGERERVPSEPCGWK